MRRSKHTLSHYRLHSCDMGQLVPIQCVPVLPGDTMQGQTSVLIRLSPLNTPVMHPTIARVHHWFVPNRVVWPESENGGWEQFITSGPDGTNSQTVPTTTNTGAGNDKSVLSFLGVPPCGGSPTVSALPLRAYNEIVNKRYRDQDLVTERTASDNTIFNIAWEKDNLTTARPWTQKGPAVTLPTGTSAPIHHPGSSGDELVVYSDGDAQYSQFSNTAQIQMNSTLGSSADQLYADLSSASAINVNQFREAFALQRYAEARARYGSRFVEYLRYLGIRPSDARLQEPEYLGGGTARINFSEVLQTAQTATGGNTTGDGVGDLFGHGIAGVRTPRFRKFFEEHGFLITLLSVRPKAVYMNGVDREWLKQNREDFFQRELANLGQQEVYNGEIWCASATSGNVRDTFGYGDRYYEYRGHPSMVGQDFRSTLNAWHMARDLPNTTTLNSSFVTCDPTKRIFQVDTDDVLWVMVNNRLVARRQVPKIARPRIL